MLDAEILRAYIVLVLYYKECRQNKLPISTHTIHEQGRPYETGYTGTRFEKATLSAWAKILYKEDMIDLIRYTRMILAIWRLKDETPVSSEPEEAALDEKTGLQMAG